jgi:hypothetical protein
MLTAALPAHAEDNVPDSFFWGRGYPTMTKKTIVFASLALSAVSLGYATYWQVVASQRSSDRQSYFDAHVKDPGCYQSNSSCMNAYGDLGSAQNRAVTANRIGLAAGLTFLMVAAFTAVTPNPLQPPEAARLRPSITAEQGSAGLRLEGSF